LAAIEWADTSAHSFYKYPLPQNKGAYGMRWWKMGMGFTLFGGLPLIMQIVSTESYAGALEGRWGGDRLQLVIESNKGSVVTDCASGTINGPIKLTSDGKFVASGTFEPHRGGPQRADEPAAPANANYTGEVKQDVMRLSILAAGTTSAQVFNLRKGAVVKLVRCL
jgi:hypothetical protein